jgi:GntR family transcriptional regulator, transcriptional repressor for pyruvate dehydrogenase complex
MDSAHPLQRAVAEDSAPTETRGRKRMAYPRAADIIAAELRKRIIEGEVPDGTFLPKQDELLEEFQVSRPSLREALRILEAEGLLAVQRGTVGGSLVRIPTPETVAYTIGLSLQSRHASLGDIATALRAMEPIAAEMCASRVDGRGQMLAELEGIAAASEGVVDDIDEFTRLSRAFHERLVANCPNETMRLLVGALEVLWSHQESAWAKEATACGAYPDKKVRQSALRAHRQIIDAIRSGSADTIGKLVEYHLADSGHYPPAVTKRVHVTSSPSGRATLGARSQ